MVYLRAKAGQLVTDEEIQQVRNALPAPKEKFCYALDFKKDTITIHEANLPPVTPGDYPFFRSPAQILEFRRNHALYQPMMRFVLVDRKQNLFHPERYCFRGAIDTWIPIGEANPLPSLLKKYLVHLGKDSFYELF